MVSEEFYAIEKKFNALKSERNTLRSQLKDVQARLDRCLQNKTNAMKARAILQTVAEATQKQLQYHISSLVSMALASVFPNPYKFEVEFVQKRNKVECVLWLVRRGERAKPMGSVGGGVLDVVSFACRIAMWSLKKNRPVMILDEPFKFLHSPELQNNCALMVKELNRKLGVQFIIVTDQSSMGGDRVFSVKNGMVKLL